MHTLELHVLSVLRREAGVQPESKGLVSVSGGPDSAALLRLLAAVAPRMKLRLEVAHFDHALRPESAEEAEWVRSLSHGLRLPFHLRRTEHLRALTAGVQAAARAWRREELRRLAVQTGAGWIATGHQLDDHLETILLKLLRGAHLSRLVGMDVRSGADGGVPWIRPVLHTNRLALQLYLTELGQTWLEDPTNASPAYKRNRVRGELLPLLNELAGGAIGARLLALERQSRALGRALDRVLSRPGAPGQSDPAAAGHWIDIAGLLGLPPLAQGAALYRFVQDRMPGELEYRRIEDVLALLRRPRPGRDGTFQVHLPGGRILRRKRDRLWLEARAAAPDPRERK